MLVCSLFLPMHLLELQNCIRSKLKDDILLIGCDCNSSLGISYGRRPEEEQPSIGKFGLPHRNDAGVRSLTFIETMNLIAITTYFQKSSYTTWTHPRSKLPHQIDHLISEKPNFCRFTDAFVTKPLVLLATTLPSNES